jgi:hypothetical protein
MTQNQKHGAVWDSQELYAAPEEAPSASEGQADLFIAFGLGKLSIVGSGHGAAMPWFVM